MNTQQYTCKVNTHMHYSCNHIAKLHYTVQLYNALSYVSITVWGSCAGIKCVCNVHIHMYIYMCVRKHVVFTNAYVEGNIFLRACTHTSMHTRINAYTHQCRHTPMQAHVHASARQCIRASNANTCPCKRASNANPRAHLTD